MCQSAPASLATSDQARRLERCRGRQPVAAMIAAVVMLAATQTVAERIFLTLEQAIADAEYIVAGNVLGYDPPDPRQRRHEHGRWTRTEALVEVTDVLKERTTGVVSVGATLRVVQRRSATGELDTPRDITKHASGSLWFLIKRERGTFAILHGDSVSEDSGELRRQISLWVRSQAGLTPFFTATSVDEVAEFAREGFDINEQDYFGDTALHWAVANDRLEVVGALLKHGARTDIADRHAQNALDVALNLGREAIVARLREAGATAHGILALDHRLSRYDALLGYGPDLNARTLYGDTPLTLRIGEVTRPRSTTAVGRDAPQRHEDLAKVRWLLDHGAQPSYPAGVRQPIHAAIAPCEPGWRPVVELLLAAGADLNAADSSGDPLLLTPVECGAVDSVKWLLARGADPKAADACGFTPLFSHLPYIRIEMLRLLLAAGMPLAPGSGSESAMAYCGFRAQEVRRWWAGCALDDGCRGLTAVFEEFGADPALALAGTD